MQKFKTRRLDDYFSQREFLELDQMKRIEKKYQKDNEVEIKRWSKDIFRAQRALLKER